MTVGGIEREEDFAEVLDDSSIVDVLDDLGLHERHIGKCVLKVVGRDGRVLRALLLKAAKLLLFGIKVAPLERLVRRGSSRNQPKMVAKEAINHGANEDREHPQTNDGNRRIHQILENVRVRRLLKSATGVSIVPEIVALDDTHEDHSRQVGNVVDEKASEEEEEQKPAKVQQADAVVDPGAVMIVASSITITRRWMTGKAKVIEGQNWSLALKGESISLQWRT